MKTTVKVFMSMFVFLSFSAPLWATAPVVRSVEVKGLTRMEKEEFLHLFEIRLNEPLDRAAVTQGIKRAVLTNLFDDIEVIRDDADPERIIIKVREKDIISSISVRGLERLGRSEVLDYFPLKISSFFFGDEMKPALKDLKVALVNSGFPDVGVGGKVVLDDVKHTAKIFLSVSEGDPLIIKRIVIKGTDGPEEQDMIILKMKIFPDDIYDEEHTISRLRKVEEYYRQEGYFSAAFDRPVFRDGTLEITFNKGKLLVIDISGNSFFSDSRLKEELSFRDAGSIQEELIEEAVSRIVSLYHESGFPFIQIAPVVHEDGNSVKMTFFVHEGPQVRIGRIDIEGNGIDKQKLLDVLMLKEGDVFNPDGIDQDREQLQEFYFALGYVDCSIDDFSFSYDKTETEADIRIRISEGLQRLISKIGFSGNKSIGSEELGKFIRIKPLMPYNEIDISDSRYAILNLYRQRGFLNAEVVVKRQTDGKWVPLEFEISEGKQFYFGATIVRGNRDVKTKVITRQLLNMEGEPFNVSMLRRNTQKLYKLGLFSNIDYRIVDDTGDVKDVIIDVNEGNAGAVEFGAGYGDYERYRGYLDISYRNFFGMNRQARIRTELTTLSEKYILSAFEPWLYYVPGAFGPVSLHINLIKERRTEKNPDTSEVRYKVNKHTIAGDLETNLSERLKSAVTYSYSLVDPYEVSPDAVLSKEDTGTLAISSVRPALIYDSRDNPFNPRSGVLSSLSLEVASGYILSETDFVKLEFYSNFYQGLSKRFTAAVSLRGGVAEGYGDTMELPITERFTLGGRNTVRGFAQDSIGPKGADGTTPVGGNVFMMGNLELRTDVGRGIGIVTFLDAGNLWGTIKQTQFGKFRYSAGAGLRYMTPVGPIRLDYGYKLNREPGESPGELHFSIGHAF